jgi:hypothetical protein
MLKVRVVQALGSNQLVGLFKVPTECMGRTECPTSRSELAISPEGECPCLARPSTTLPTVVGGTNLCKVPPHWHVPTWYLRYACT